MKRATATHFINKSLNTVLLAYQREKVIGLKGFGGKIKPGQTPWQNAVIEVSEETGGVKEKRINPEEEGGIVFDPQDLVPVALIDFYNGTDEEVPFGKPSFRVLFYNCYKFSGRAIDTEEMYDAWYYPIDGIPKEKLPIGDEEFLQPILEGNLTRGWMRRTADFKTVLGSHFEPAVIEDLVI